MNKLIACFLAGICFFLFFYLPSTENVVKYEGIEKTVVHQGDLTKNNTSVFYDASQTISSDHLTIEATPEFKPSLPDGFNIVKDKDFKEVDTYFKASYETISIDFSSLKNSSEGDDFTFSINGIYYNGIIYEKFNLLSGSTEFNIKSDQGNALVIFGRQGIRGKFYLVENTYWLESDGVNTYILSEEDYHLANSIDNIYDH